MQRLYPTQSKLGQSRRGLWQVKLKRKNCELIVRCGGCLPLSSFTIREILGFVDGCWEKPYYKKISDSVIRDKSTGKMYKIKVKYELEEV